MKIETLSLDALPTNCYILTDEENRKAVVIDPADLGKNIYDKVKSSGCVLEYILLTHGHFDHIGGADELAGLSGAPVCVSSPDAELLCDGEKNASIGMNGEPTVCRTSPLIFDDGAEFKAGSIALTAVFTPGHTKGSVCFFAGDTVFTGDTVFSGGYGRTDLYGGDHAEIYRTLMKLLPKLKGKRIYPGHGECRDF